MMSKLPAFAPLARYTDVVDLRKDYRPIDELDEDIAAQAYNGACHHLKDMLPERNDFDSLVKHRTSIEEILDLVSEAKTRYDKATERHRPVMKILKKVSKTILLYANVLDTLAQHHPEYVSLVWGSLKFILRGLINHEELLERFGEALVEIGNVLPQARLSAALFKTTSMKHAVGQLYAHIILFLQSVLQWYTTSRVGRAVRAIFRPFEIEHKDTVQQVKSCAKSIDDIAQGASRAEQRDMHLAVQEMNIRDEKLMCMQIELQNVTNQIQTTVDQVLQNTTAHTAILQRVDNNVSDMAPKVQDVHFAQILQLLRPNASDDALLCRIRSINKRSRLAAQVSTDSQQVAKSLSQWMASEGRIIFILKVGLGAAACARAIAADVIGNLQAQGVTVVWHLSPIGKPNGKEVTFSTLLQGLLYQTLRQHPALLSESEAGIAKFAAPIHESEWIKLLGMLWSRVNSCFIVIEALDLFQKHQGDRDTPADFYKAFHEIFEYARSENTTTKVLLLSHNNSVAIPTFENTTLMTASLKKPMPTNQRSRHFAKSKRDKQQWQRKHIRM